MINEKKAKGYCSQDISLIENYHQAVWDPYEKWEIHHRKECNDDGKTLFTQKQLIEMNRYYKRPAEELIFVTRAMHSKIHREMRSKKYKEIGKKTGAINGKKGAIKQSIPILQFAKDGEFIKEWQSAYEACRQLRISQASICCCCKGKSKTAGGYTWKYKLS